MKDMTHLALLDRIREKCQQDGWYGGELESPVRRYPRDDDPRRLGFAFAPVGEEQMSSTEAALGFPLFPLLRTLYANLANGGFGPGGGLRGAIGGYGTITDSSDPYDLDHTIVGYYNFHRKRAQLIDIAVYAKEWKSYENREAYLILPYAVWPEHFLSFCDLGCCQHACLDGKAGRVFCTAPTENEAEYVLWLLSPSLEDFLGSWLKGEVLP
jgi:hypothetical protein